MKRLLKKIKIFFLLKVEEFVNLNKRHWDTWAILIVIAIFAGMVYGIYRFFGWWIGQPALKDFLTFIFVGAICLCVVGAMGAGLFVSFRAIFKGSFGFLRSNWREAEKRLVKLEINNGR